MDAYGYLAFFLILFVFFIYIVWFGYSVKLENQKEQGDKVSINPYDQIPLRRRLIDKKNSKVGIFDLGESLHWWGGSKSEDVGPPPKPPTPPKLEDIPKPQQIQVGGPVMTSGKYHQNTAPASVINSSMMRR